MKTVAKSEHSRCFSIAKRENMPVKSKATNKLSWSFL